MKPEDVLHNWDIPNLDIEQIRRSSSGLLNKTFLFRAGDSKHELFVLQLVHPAVSMDGAMNNYFHVTQFLQEQGHTTQTLIPTKTGALWIDEPSLPKDSVGNSWRWRLLKGVEGNVFDKENNPEAITNDLAREAGGMLAKFHSVLSQYPKQLVVGRVSHQYGYQFEKLTQLQEQLITDADESIREMAQLVITEIPKLMLPEDLPKIIVHADPKVSNFVFHDDGSGVCMIDLDTIQYLTPLFDLGDAIRSWGGQKEDDPANPFDAEITHAFVQGYLTNSKGLLSEREQSLIPQAAKLIMLGLATRFLNDYIEDYYFGWDETRYENRKAHNKARAMGQISLYQSALKSL